jgi:hypothetical protein
MRVPRLFDPETGDVELALFRRGEQGEPLYLTLTSGLQPDEIAPGTSLTLCGSFGKTEWWSWTDERVATPFGFEISPRLYFRSGRLYGIAFPLPGWDELSLLQARVHVEGQLGKPESLKYVAFWNRRARSGEVPDCYTWRCRWGTVRVGYDIRDRDPLLTISWKV